MFNNSARRVLVKHMIPKRKADDNGTPRIVVFFLTEAVYSGHRVSERESSFLTAHQHKIGYL